MICLLFKVCGGIEPLLSDGGPALVPVQPPDLHPGQALPLAVIVMIAEPLPASLREDPGVTRPYEPARPGQQETAASLRHQHSSLVSEGAAHRLRATNVNLVGGVHSAAAAKPVDEEVVESLVFVEVGSLYPLHLPTVLLAGRAPGQIVVGGGSLLPPVVLHLASSHRVQLRRPNPASAEDQVVGAVLVPEGAGVDTVGHVDLVVGFWLKGAGDRLPGVNPGEVGRHPCGPGQADTLSVLIHRGD